MPYVERKLALTFRTADEPGSRNCFVACSKGQTEVVDEGRGTSELRNSGTRTRPGPRSVGVEHSVNIASGFSGG